MARLTTSMLVAALTRLAQAAGGFAAVLAKGDPTAGAMLVILAERGRKSAVLERLLQPDGGYLWQDIGQSATDEPQLNALIERRRKYDPDLWVLELDIPIAERFAAEMNAVT
ncbi:MAG: hypothetical protein JWN69_1969 [Alphaproteobacteria bacterium]|nr:hypothetical protein [Alphaproteobacteria bacterium]